jgi:N-acylneuraminate cytidylyltransferase
MILQMVPARGGSKRIPRKNILPLGNKPLMVWTLEAALAAGIGPCVVSTEDAEIATMARTAGAEVIERPEALAGDTASTEAAVLHVLDTLAGQGRAFDWVMLLQPTSPFRQPETIRRLAAMATPDQPADCVMTVTETRADFWRGDHPENQITRLFPDAPRRQQAREPLYEENSAIYLVRVSTLRKTGSVIGRHVAGVPISPLEGFDINTEWDFQLAEALVAQGHGAAQA